MDQQLPAEQEKIYRRLTERWITTRQTVDKQIDGCNTIISAMLETLNPLLGEVSTSAVMNRTSILAGRKYALLNDLGITQNGLDTSRLKMELHEKSPNETREALAGFVYELFGVLNGLLSSSIIPILRDLESELAATKIEPPSGKEGS